MACREHIINLPIMYAKAYICDTIEDMPKEIPREIVREFAGSIYCYIGCLEKDETLSIYVWLIEKGWVYFGDTVNLKDYKLKNIN